MSFGGFGGFGQNNNNQQTSGSGFGGFGSSNNTTGTGFGTSNTNTGFGTSGTNTSGGGLFGTNSSGFGSGGGTFGGTGNTTTPFGSKPAFGGASTSTGGGLFGNTTSTAGASSTGFGGFGSTNTTTPAPTGFGGSNTGNLFGNKTSTFGGTNTGTSLFGGSGSGGFGSGNSTSAFGGANSTALTQNPGQNNGTGSVPFTAHKEQEGTTSTTNHFQTITFISPYQGFSLEELRLADYNQGRRFGNASGQAGAFGTNSFGTTSGGGTGFGGNTTSTNLFGSSGTNTSTGFGGNTSGFGGASTNTGGGLFGAASKPTSLFGSTATASPKPSGGLFGGTSGGSGFGGTNNTSTGFGGTGNSLFGGSGTSNNTSTGSGFTFGGAGTTGGFGQNNTPGFGSANTSSGTGLFGSTATSAPFGGQTTQATAGSNLFGGFGGQQTQQPSQPGQTSSLFGGGFGSNQQPKPGGLFGGSNNTATTGSSLFGNNNQQSNQQSSGGLFGSNNQNQSSGGLFGTKPATGTSTGTGLFGNTTQNNNISGGGLFGGGNQTQQSAAGGLFGGAAQSKPGGLFGGLGTSTSNAGSSLFGSNNNNSNQQQQGSSLFPSISTNPGQPSQPGNSLFAPTLNGSQQSNPQALHQQGLQASLVDINSFGDSQGFFSGVSNLPDVGPLATPLSSSQKQRKSTLLPAYRTNPASASKLFTPVRQGYGLQYSRYGTPGSAFSSAASTPAGLSSSLLRNSFSKNLGKSLSTSNLRHTYEADESILAPGAFTPTGRRMNSGIKTLHINRGLRGDLFGTPTPTEQPKALTGSEKNDSAPLGRSIRKRVSFDADVSGGLPEGSSNGSTPSAQEQGFLRSSKNINGSNGAAKSGPSQPEMEQVRGNELAVVHEDDPNPANLLSQPAGPANSQDDLRIGDYWMRPSKEELSKLSPDKLKKVENFIVGRQGCGYVKFDRPVDLSAFKLDRIPDEIVHITTRAITVYPVASQKPPQGKGLNVPSTIALQNSWPRAKGGKDKVFERNGPKFNKHVERLKRVTDTEFISYDRDTGVWTFTVQHFTTYGLEYDDETDGDDLNQSTLSLPPDSPSPAPRKLNGNHTPRSYAPPSTGQRSIFHSDVPSETDSPQVDDTFRFKAYKPQTIRGVPGAFDDEVMAVETAYESDDQSFLDDRSVGSSRQDGDDESSQVDDVTNGEFDESVMDEEEDPASLYPPLGHTTEPVNYQNSLMLSTRTDPFVAPTPKSILKNTTSRRRMSFGTPTKVNLDLDADWTEQLQRTISPKKQDRVALRQNQEVLLQTDDAGVTPKADRSTMADTNEFRNSMDLMNSLWGKESGRKAGKGKRGLEIDRGIQWPYAKKSKTFDLDVSSMDQNDRGFYESFKPSWSQSGMLVCVAPIEKNHNDQTQAFRASGVLGNNRITLASEGRNVELIPFDLPSNPSPKLLAKQRQNTKITAQNGVPYARTTTTFNFKDLANTIDGQDAQAVHERSAWELVGILFDSVGHHIPKGASAEEQAYLESRLRKDNLSDFWVQLVQGAATQQVQLAKSAEEKVIAHLSAHDIEGACSGLVDGRNFRLATLVALIGGDERMRDDMKAQIQTWREAKSLSEFEEPIRAIYELLTGNVCGAYGMKGPAEDRATTFLFSERFGFNWRQSFGMRLWYAIFEEDPLELAVQKFSEELETPQKHHGDELQETSRPVPWFVEQKISKLWRDPNIAQRQDLLWSLLRLYADDSEKSSDILDDVLLPHNHQLSPLDYRLSWLLYQNLSAKEIAQFPSGKEKGRIVYDERVDRLTLDYAWQLERSGDWSWATFVLLHVHDHNNRQTALQSIIARHAGEIGGRQSLHFVDLVTNFRIPESWVWEAKALYAREVERDFIAEVDFLLKAHNWEEAHKTLCSIVAPHAIVEGNYSALERILSGFENVDLVRDWHLGGQVYLDFIHMRHLTEGTSESQAMHPKQKGLPKENDIDDVLNRLVSTLPAMATKDRNVEFLQQVAVQEMSGIVGKALMARREANHSADLSRVLQLPLTEDMYLKHSVNLSFDYYRTLMAGGK